MTSSQKQFHLNPAQLQVQPEDTKGIKKFKEEYYVEPLSEELKKIDHFCVCGVDPGIRGGISFIHKKQNLINIDTFKIPTKANTKCKKEGQLLSNSYRKRFVDPYKILQLCKRYVNLDKKELFSLGVIEQVHAFPHQGLVSTFNFGKETGMAEAILWVTSRRVYHVHVVSWKKRFNLKGKKNDRNYFLQNLQHRVDSILDFVKKNSKCEVLVNMDPNHDGQLEALLLSFYSLERLNSLRFVCNVDKLPNY
jgi:hypothetical protein